MGVFTFDRSMFENLTNSYNVSGVVHSNILCVVSLVCLSLCVSLLGPGSGDYSTALRDSFLSIDRHLQEGEQQTLYSCSRKSLILRSTKFMIPKLSI